MILPPAPLTRQPSQALPLAEDYADALIAFVPSLGLSVDATGRQLVAPINRPTQGVSAGGMDVVGVEGVDRPYLQPASLFATPAAATLISIQAQFAGSGDLSLWHHVQTSTGNAESSLFGFSGNWYIATFSGSRWATQAISGDLRAPHVAVVTGSGTNRAAYLRGRQIASTSSGGAMSTTVQQIAGSDNGGFRSLQRTYGVFLIPRSLSAAEIADKFSTPERAWASLFQAPRRKIWPVVPAAPSGIPTLSAATVTSITATTARPRVTITF